MAKFLQDPRLKAYKLDYTGRLYIRKNFPKEPILGYATRQKMTSLETRINGIGLRSTSFLLHEQLAILIRQHLDWRLVSSYASIITKFPTPLMDHCLEL